MGGKESLAAMFTLLTDAQLEPLRETYTEIDTYRSSPGEPRGCVPLPVIYEDVNTSGPLPEGEPTAVR